MFTFLNCRATKAISAAVVSLNFGLGLASPSFGHAVQSANVDFGQPGPDQTGELTAETLGGMLQSMHLSINQVNDNGQIYYQVNIPALKGNPAVAFFVAVSPNKKYVNIWYTVAQLGQQNSPPAPVLLAMLQSNDKTLPSYLGIEGNYIVLRDNLDNSGVTAAELMEQLKLFYTAIQQTRPICVAPVETPAPSNPFE